MAKESVVIIKPSKTNFYVDLYELWRYRELFYIFAWRDIKIRYKQTILGVIWVILQPLVQMAIFTYFFGKIASIPSGRLPYFLFVLTGLVFWNYFSNTLSQASNSMIENENIIKKVYFPKIILPLSSAVTGLVDFLINLSILLTVALFFGFMPSLWAIIIIPLAWLITAMTAGGLGLLLAAFNVKYRDVRYILPFFIQLLLFLTPIIYPLSLVSSSNRFFILLNPITGVVENARLMFDGNNSIDWTSLGIGFLSMVLIVALGISYFKRTERYFADIV